MTTKQKTTILAILVAATAVISAFLFSIHNVSSGKSRNISRASTAPKQSLHSKGSAQRTGSSARKTNKETVCFKLEKTKTPPGEIKVDRWIGKQSGREALADNFGGGSRFESWKNPRGDLILVNSTYSKDGHSRFGIFDTQATLVCTVPERHVDAGEEYLLSFWLWKDERTLVGTMCHYKNPDDTESADKARIFAFLVDKTAKTGKLIPVETPAIPPGHAIRLEGITKDGRLVLSDVFSGNDLPNRKFVFGKTKYSANPIMGREKFLGSFELLPVVPHQ